MGKTKSSQNKIFKTPVVTMLGHVDHGKTSILDAIRGTKVQEGEVGGITQNVRAHSIEHKTKDEKIHKITFIDTPGHEAFSQMRSRGAKITDIVILVVAVDDGVQPQTKEAIKYALEAKVPIIVALNKIDIKGVDKAKVKRDLSSNGVQIEELGGDVLCIETSAKEKKGINELLDSIILISEMNEMYENQPTLGKGTGVILESTKDQSLGHISLCLIKTGEVKTADYVLCENQTQKVRTLKDEYFQDLPLAKAGDAIWIAGFCGEQKVGEIIHFFETEKEAKEAIKEKIPAEINEEATLQEEADPDILAQLLQASSSEEDKISLNVIVKSGNLGTLEVVEDELKKLSTDEIELNIYSSKVGEITKEDILEAKSIGGIVIGFKSKLSKQVTGIAKLEKVLAKNYEIIYELLDEVQDVIISMAEPKEIETEVARAVVKKVFKLSNGKIVGGCQVIKGNVLKGYSVFVERPSLTEKRIGNGKIVVLKHNKQEVKEAQKGSDCGIMIEPQIELEVDDEIVCFKIEKV